MAVSNKESQANIQNLLSQGVTQDFLNSQNYGPKLNADEASNILNAFRGQNAYTASNVVNASSGTPNQPDDLLGIRNALQNEFQIPQLTQQYQTGIENLANMPTQLAESMGINTAQQQYTEALQAMRNASTEMMNQISTADDLPVVLNKIRGIQAQLQEQGNRKVATLGTQAQTLGENLQNLQSQANQKITQEQARLDALNQRIMSAKQEAEAQFGIRSSEVEQKRQLILQNPKAGIKASDSWDAVAGKLQAYQDKEEIRQLQLQYPNAKIKKNSSFEDAVKAIRKSIDTSAGKDLFSKTFGYLPKKYGSKEKKMLKDYFDEEYKYVKDKRALELADIKSSISKRNSSGGSSKETKESIRQEGIAGIRDSFEQIKGGDGYINPTDYKKAKAQWAVNKLPASEFDTIFAPYRNPNDKYK